MVCAHRPGGWIYFCLVWDPRRLYECGREGAGGWDQRFNSHSLLRSSGSSQTAYESNSIQSQRNGNLHPQPESHICTIVHTLLFPSLLFGVLFRRGRTSMAPARSPRGIALSIPLAISLPLALSLPVSVVVAPVAWVSVAAVPASIAPVARWRWRRARSAVRAPAIHRTHKRGRRRPAWGAGSIARPVKRRVQGRAVRRTVVLVAVDGGPAGW